jgi:hypothetical protein
MPYIYSTVSPTPAWVSVDNAGKITVDRANVPAGGYTGTARIQLGDGTTTTTIDIPINIQQSATYGFSFVEQSIARSALRLTARSIDIVAQEPVVMRGAFAIASRTIDTQLGGGGGGGSGIEEMTLDYSTTGVLLNSKPASAGSDGDGVQVIREQSFKDLSGLGFGDQRLTDSYYGGVYDLDIYRAMVWRYSSNAFDWLPGPGEIKITTNSVDGSALDNLSGMHPRGIGLYPDFEGQICYVAMLNPNANGSTHGYERWVAHRSPEPTGLPIAGETDVYWDWANHGHYYTGYYSGNNGGGS